MHYYGLYSSVVVFIHHLSLSSLRFGTTATTPAIAESWAGERLALAHIDVEGAEEDVLEGARVATRRRLEAWESRPPRVGW